MKDWTNVVARGNSIIDAAEYGIRTTLDGRRATPYRLRPRVVINALLGRPIIAGDVSIDMAQGRIQLGRRGVMVGVYTKPRGAR